MTSSEIFHEHFISNKLEFDEINSLRKHAEKNKCLILASGIIELWQSQRPDHRSWIKFDTGIICFIKDYFKKSYYLRLYSIAPHILWEQEIYIPFTYDKVTPNFHFFPADDYNVGFNFAFSEEAEIFYDAFIKKYNSSSTTKRRSTKIYSTVINTPTSNQSRSSGYSTASGFSARNSVFTNSSSRVSSNTQTNNSNVTLRNNFIPQTINEDEEDIVENNNNRKTGLSSLKANIENIKYGMTRKIKKVDKKTIGIPNDFRIVQHVGMSNNQYQYKLADDDFSKKLVGILSELNLKSNRRTQAFLGEFVKSHGGIEAVENELSKSRNTRTTKNMGNTKERITILPRNSSISSNALASFYNPPEQQFSNEINILDHLKAELDKRAQYLNESSDDENGVSDSEWDV